MAPEQLFSLFTLLASVGWLFLALLPRWRPSSTLVAPVIIPAAIGLLYLWIIVTRFAGAEGDFNSLDGVKTLLSQDWMLLAGWIHYLAFDLFIGAWEVRDARRLGIHHVAVLPCLALTFFFGPIGLLLYSVIRAAWRKQIAIEAADVR